MKKLLAATLLAIIAFNGVTSLPRNGKSKSVIDTFFAELYLKPDVSDARITFGEKAELGQFPYIVSFRDVADIGVYVSHKKCCKDF